MVFCSIASCSSHINCAVSFFPLPKKRSVREQWLQVCSYENTDHTDIFVCSLHFKPKDFASSVGGNSGLDSGTKKLHLNALPTVGVPLIPKKLSDRREKREIRRYLLDTQRRNSIRSNGFDVYTNILQQDSEVYSRQHSSSLNLTFQSVGVNNERKYAKLIRKLLREVQKLESCCNYWNAVAMNRGKKLAKMKLQKGMLMRQIALLKDGMQNRP